jgi:hypothetical protein
MPGSSSWLPYAPQGVKGLDDYDDDDDDNHDEAQYRVFFKIRTKYDYKAMSCVK